MSGTTISGTITIGVTLASPSYSSPLTITSAGVVAPAGYFVPDKAGHDAIYIYDKSMSVSLMNGGLIQGGAGVNGGNGLDVTSLATIENAGTIIGGSAPEGSGGLGVVLLQRGMLDNGGTIIGGYGYGDGGEGVAMGNATLVNDGLVLGGFGGFYGGNAVELFGSGTFINNGTVAANDEGTGVYVSGSEYVSNHGTPLSYATSNPTITNNGVIYGGDYGGAGVVIQDGANFTNANGGIYGGIGYGGGVGVVIYGNAILTNASTIVGGLGYFGGYAASLFNGGTAVNKGVMSGGFGYYTGGPGVVLEQNATFINMGTVLGGDGASNGGVGIYLGGIIDNGTIAGTLINAGTIVGGYGIHGGAERDAVELNYSIETVVVEPGAVFIGTVSADPGFQDVLEVDGTSSIALTGIGTEFVGFSDIDFSSGAQWMLEGDVEGFAAGQTIEGFSVDDTIVLNGFSANSYTYNSGIGLELSDGKAIETLNIAGGFSTASFIVTDTSIGTEIRVDTPICYLRGTRIATPAGDVPVEALVCGDAVITRFNGYRRIKWIGRQSFSAPFIRHYLEQIPVHIRAGALGPHLPRRDLYVSPGHSMLLGDTLVLASSLVNGITITQDSPPSEVHYYQLEFETHDCVLAEGAWSESFCDYGSLRNQFHNASEFWELYPHHGPPDEHVMCGRRPDSGPLLEKALRPVVLRATAVATPGSLKGWIDEISPVRIRGWAQDVANPELPVLLEVLNGDRPIGTVLACDPREDLAAAGIARGRCAFSFNAAELTGKSLSNVRVQRVLDRSTLGIAVHCQTAMCANTRRRCA